MIRLVEELALNAWPSLQTIHYDGWLLRFADGYTRRANSVNPLYSSCIDPIVKIPYCEEVYTARRQDVVFKMTSAVLPEDLDATLAARGYGEAARTSVQTLDLASIDQARTQDVSVTSDLAGDWIAAFCRLNNVDDRHVPTMTRMLNNIVPTRGFMALRQDDQPDGEIIAVGLAVIERGYVGLFDIVTAPHLRNRGLGTRLVLGLLDWGRANGANHAYLQVMHSNAPALHLYARLGFNAIYSYWYRVKPRPA